MVIAQQIRGALDELGRSVPVLLISADPANDTPASVKRFLRQVSLSGRVRWLNGQRHNCAGCGTPSACSGERRPRSFHANGLVFLIDRSSHERVIFQLEQLTPEALSHDVRKLLE